MRATLGLLLGIVVALAQLIAVEAASAWVHPFPADFNGTHEEICAHVARYPTWVLMAVVPAWALVAFVSVRATRSVARSMASALVVAALLVGALGANLWMLPYPAWFKLGAFAAICLAVTLAARGIRSGTVPHDGSCA